MAERIKHISELPCWFDLGKYDAAAGLDLLGWYEQLAVRRDVADLGNPPALLERIRECPVAEVFFDEILSQMFLREGWRTLTTLKPFYAQAVCIVPKTDVVQTREFPSATDVVDASHAAIVHVNLGLPDKVLVEAFRLFLKRGRTNEERAGRRAAKWRDPSFSTWIRAGLLPYLDLRSWEREAEVRIPYRVMADAIFPPGAGGAEDARKTTATLADKVLTDEYLESLAARAVQLPSDPRRYNAAWLTMGYAAAVAEGSTA